MGSADSHRRCRVPIALGQQLAPSFSRLHEPHPQRFVGTHEVIVRTPPLQMGEPEKPNPCKEALRVASVPRRITCETRTSLRQRSAFFHLAIDQTSRHLPSFALSSLDGILRTSVQNGPRAA
jgi:hypothetical protein